MKYLASAFKVFTAIISILFASIANSQIASVEAQSSPACPDGICPGLGNSFFLPATDILNLGGVSRAIFKNVKLGECVRISPTRTQSRDFKNASNMVELVKSLTNESNIEGGYKSVELAAHATASVTTGSSSDTTKTFRSTTLDISIGTHILNFLGQSKCLARDNIDSTYLNEFETLELFDGKSTNSPISWAPYNQFLRSNGSHINFQQILGSRFQQWQSSAGSGAVSLNDLQAKACADVEGVDETGAGWSVKACAGYTKSEKRTALRKNTENRRLILGGSLKASTDLTKDMNQENLNAFIDSAASAHQAIQFQFSPVWQILIQIYNPLCTESGKGSKSCDHLQRAYNLQAAYEAQLALGCPLLESGGYSYQQMKVDSTNDFGIKTYACRAEKTGCKKDRDCHVGGSGTVCYCYGPSCFTDPSALPGTNLHRTIVQGSRHGAYSNGVNNSCKYDLWEVECNCRPSWAGGLPDRDLYTQSTSY